MQTRIGKYASTLTRMGQVFYDRMVRRHGIRGGQQFYMIEISQAPGITVNELARTGDFDNGSATRAAQRLAAQGYVTIVPDKSDKRVKRLYATDKADALIADALAARGAWNEIFLKGLTEEEIETADRLLRMISENARTYIKEKKSAEHDN